MSAENHVNESILSDEIREHQKKNRIDHMTYLPDMEDIFDGKMPPVPAGTDALYALTASMVSYAGKCADDLTKIANSIRYADRMPPDFSALLMKDYMYLKDGYREKLMLVPEFRRWLQEKGRLIYDHI